MILKSPIVCFFYSLEWKAIFCSVVFSYGRGRFWTIFYKGAFCFAFVHNLAISLLRTLTSGVSCFWITVVVGDIGRTVLTGAEVSHSPMRSFFERLVTFLANLSSNDVSNFAIGYVNLICRIKRDTVFFLSLFYLRSTSTWALFIASTMRISLPIPSVIF